MSNTTPGSAKRKTSLSAFVQNTILVGMLTAAPIVVTFFILQFLFELVASAGRPLIIALADSISYTNPSLSKLLSRPAIEDALGVFIVILCVFVLGLLARQVIGDRILQMINNLIDRIPLANKIYGPLQQLVKTLQRPPDGMQRVVLVNYPNSEVRAVGIVTRTMKDRLSGEELAAVFIPTTPNPTAGYLTIVPVSRIVPLGISMDDAMSFVISGGVVGPDVFRYTGELKVPPETGPELR